MKGPLDLFRAWRERRRARREAKKRKGPTDHWLREALETIATAVIMAIVVRHFAVEAFAIPTESMAPTLYGEEYGHGAGDRLLVNKYPLYWRDPERWAIVVFRYPLDTSQNFVKRLVGLPGETLEIRDGDVWADGRILRKPEKVQEEVWRPIHSVHHWERDDGSPVLPDRPLPIRASGEPRRIRIPPVRFDERTFHHVDPTARGIRAAVSDAYHVRQQVTGAVGDLRLRATVRVESGDGDVVFRIAEHDRVYELVLAVGGDAVVRMDGEEHRVEGLRLSRGEDLDVALVNVDDAVEVQRDGDRVWRREYETDGRPTHTDPENAVEIEVREATVVLDDLAVDRDIFYGVMTGWVGRFHVPPERFVMLGDNSSNSRDSRAWTEHVILLRDGRHYRVEARRDPRTGRDVSFQERGGRLGFVDVQGVERDVAVDDLVEPRLGSGGNARVIRLANGDEQVVPLSGVSWLDGTLRFRAAGGSERSVSTEDLAVPGEGRLEHTPFVTRDQIVGEAFFVFWPLGVPEFRVRFL